MIPFGPLPVATGPAAPEDFVDVLAFDELPPASQKSVAVGFHRVLLCHTPDGICAVADLCPHALQPLLGSEVRGGVIRCVKHGAIFDLATGKPQNGVTKLPLRVYRVRVRAGRIEIGTSLAVS